MDKTCNFNMKTNHTPLKKKLSQWTKFENLKDIERFSCVWLEEEDIIPIL